MGSLKKHVKLRLQRPAARQDTKRYLGGGYGSLVSMVPRWIPKFCSLVQVDPLVRIGVGRPLELGIKGLKT